MSRNVVIKPIKRSRFRLFLGKTYYSFKRHLLWLFGGFAFAKKTETELPITFFTHATPLLRKLKDVDMYLQYNKITNLKIAVKKLNKVTLHPGEVLSYWKLIGRPARYKGYQKGMVLKNGSFAAGTGGGLCQLSNLIYWMTIHTPLTVLERHRHGYDVFPDSNRTQPFGSGATCYYNYGDLMIRNDTELTFQLIVGVNETHLEGAWTTNEQPSFRYEVYEKEHIMKQECWGGYTRHNVLHRKKYDLTGAMVDDEYIVENNAIMMYAPFLPEHTNEAQSKST